MTKSTLRTAILLTATIASLFAGSAVAADKNATEAETAAATVSHEVPFEDMKFSPTGFSAYGPTRPDDDSGTGIKFADAYGKILGGPHATIMKWPRGFRSVLHSHTGDYYAVVITGVMANYRPGGEVKRLGAGSFWYQKGGEAHTTECFSEDCTAVLVQDVGFDAQILGKYVEPPAR